MNKTRSAYHLEYYYKNHARRREQARLCYIENHNIMLERRRSYLKNRKLKILAGELT